MSGLALRLICIFSALSYYIAFGLYYKKQKISSYVWCVAIALNLAVIINNWVVNGYVPFVSMYQVLTFLAVTFAPTYLYMRYLRAGGFSKPYFMIAPAVVLTGVSCMDQTSVWTFPPALQSAYFVPHVLVYMISYSLTAVAFIMVIINFFKKSKEYEDGIYNIVILAYPFMIAGMLLGALWANACWGNYWSWDNKENWSLMAVLALTVYLHFRRQKGLKKYASYLIILAFVFVVITLLFVNMFGGNSLHTYS